MGHSYLTAAVAIHVVNLLNAKRLMICNRYGTPSWMCQISHSGTCEHKKQIMCDHIESSVSVLTF